MKSTRLDRHILAHPWRAAMTVLVISLLAWALVAFSLVNNSDTERRGRVENCNAVNELSRKVYITLADYGFEPYQIRRLLPTMNCEDIP